MSASFRFPKRAAWIFGFAMIAAAPAEAGTMRCGDNVLTRGLTFVEVIERCGRPDAEYRRALIYVPGVYAPVEEWTYELGSNRFRRLLTFENGRLRRIELRPKPEVPIEALELP